jgi:hypothetical protein
MELVIFVAILVILAIVSQLAGADSRELSLVRAHDIERWSR